METQAKSLVEFFEGHPERWTKGAHARSDKGLSCNFDSKKAVCFCFEGALFLVYGHETGKDAFETRMDLRYRVQSVLSARKAKTANLIDWNDAEETTFEEFISVLKEANV